jgi:hypothetical protein
MVWRSHSGLPRQDDPEFRILPLFRLHFDRATVLFHDDIVAHGKTESGTFAGRTFSR